MQNFKRTMLLIGMILFLTTTMGCEKEGPMEKVGEKIDEAIGKSENKLEKGPMEKTGEKIDDTLEKAGDKLEEGGESIQDAAEEASEKLKN